MGPHARRRMIVAIGLLALFGVAGAACGLLGADEDAIHIALVGPISGGNPSVGKAFRQGIDLYLESVNTAGGIGGKRVVLDVYDDQNNPERAKAQAEQVVRDNRAAAVIGHHYSSCSIRAGEVYKARHIPAISPASTNVKITQDNPWYFRTIFNDNSQGRFLATYANKVFGYETASIIHEDQEYGGYLAQVFEETCNAMGVEVRYKWGFEMNDPYLDQSLVQIVNELQYKTDAGVIFLATHAPEGAKLIRLMKDSLVENPIMAPDAFSSEAFQSAFKDMPKERTNPGFYTDGMFVTTPLIFDTTNEKGLQFKESYLTAYGEEPGWHAAFAYDSAMLIVEAMRRSGAADEDASIAELRERIRDALGDMTNPYEAIEGVTGYTYFDRNGDSQKPIFIGVYRKQNIVSALIQFRAISNLNEVPNFDKAVEDGRILIFDGRYSYKVNLIYTGIKINEISELDPKTFNANLDFYLWFRYRGGIDLQNIEFLNALEPIQLGEPAHEKETDGQVYRLYHVKGRFRADFLPSQHIFGQHILGFSFRPRGLDRNSLIFVKDVLGMRLRKGQSPGEKLRQSGVMKSVEEWRIGRVWFYQDIAEKDSLGDPNYLNLPDGTLEYSRFNVGIRIKPDTFSIRRIIPRVWGAYLLGISTIVAIFLSLSVRGRVIRPLPNLRPHDKTVWIFQIVFAIVWLLSAESYLLHQLSHALNQTYFEAVVLSFDVLWWLVTAHFLSTGLERFLWEPIEERSGRDIPHIVRNLVTLMIYMMALFAIVAFVFDQRLTSLLATSGVIAMIVGLAVQINIANIFSGIAINLERPFRIDDWVKIGRFTEGKVVDVNWRATRLLTRDSTILTIPNSQASESSIENFSYPSDAYFKYFTVHVDASHEPDRVKKVLLDAALATDGVLDNPPPGTRFLGLTNEMTGPSEAWAANYLISVFVRDYGQKFAHNEMIWLNVWKHLHHAGIRLITERREIQMSLKGQKEKVPLVMSILQGLEIFEPFSDEDRYDLSQRMKRRRIKKGDAVVHQGEEGDSLFIIAEGVLGIWAAIEGKQDVEVARLGAGDFFGEMALLTGEPRTATVVAVADSILYEITKEDISPLMAKQPEISWALSNVLVRRKQATESAAAVKQRSSDIDRTLSAQILGKIQKFFGFRKQ